MNRSDGLVDKLGGIETNIVLNPNFTTDTTGWTATDSALASVSSELEITETGGVNSGKAYQDITTIVGKKYQFNYSFKKGTSSTGSVKVGTVTVEDEIYTSPSLSDATITSYTVYFTATETTTRITLISDSTAAGETSFFDAVKCFRIYNGFADIMNNCGANIYSASQPASANLAATDANKLTVISLDGLGVDGLTWEQSLLGVVSKSLTETWKGTDIKDGFIAYIRFYENGDDPSTDSTLNARLDLSISTAGADLNITSIIAVVGKERTFNYFAYEQLLTE